MFEKNYFVSPIHVPTGSLDSLSEIYASSVLVNCEPAFLVPGSTPGAGGLGQSQPAMTLYHLVKKSVRNEKSSHVFYRLFLCPRICEQKSMIE